MSPIQQMLLGVGAVATKTYVDDIFSTYVYTGDGNSSRNITNNIDLLTEGGLVWYKSRSAGKGHRLVDTERGVTKVIESNDSNAEAVEATGLKAFLTNGFTVGSDDTINESGGDQATWSFRKAPGFFDVVTWTGNGNGSRQISHSLESVPGCIMIKRTDGSYGWYVYHRGLDSSNPERYYLRLNETDASQNTTGQQWMAAAPTSTNFTLAADIGGSGYEGLNTNGETYVAYVFAGGSANSPALSISVSFDGSDDELYFGSTTDFEFGTGDFTWEAWIKPTSWGNNAWNTVFMVGGAFQNGGLWIGQNNSNNFVVRAFSDQDILTASSKPDIGVWTHVAVARSGTTLKLFYNGIEQKSVTTSYDFQDGTTSRIANDGHNQRFTGKISNLRIVKGTAVYTSNFNPSDSLTNITNTKLLCCNDSSVTGSTVTPTTITASGGPTASADSPVFTDVAANVFGDAGDQGVIKCGSYIGASGANKVRLGWEPQWVMVKNIDSAEPWVIIDSMRGWVNQSSGAISLRANSSGNESAYGPWGPTSTGWELDLNQAEIDQNEKNYIYIAIRRPDGYVGKPPSLGTDVFSLATGTNNTNPGFVSGFPVDFSLRRPYASSSSWYAALRLTGTNYLVTDGTSSEASNSNQTFDYQNGIGKWGGDLTSWMSWQWKRHAGFDVVTYKGDHVDNRQIQHSLGKSPEMIWVKVRDTTGENWVVWHSGMTGTIATAVALLNLTNASTNAGSIFGGSNAVAPTSTHWSVGTHETINDDRYNYIAMLFASVDGISKVGSYTGNGFGSQNISLGFTARFILIKRIDSTNNWLVFDSVRGMGSGNDPRLNLNNSDAENTDHDWVNNITSSGFDVVRPELLISGAKFIYYCHA